MTHLMSPSWRMSCSSLVQSKDIPGLCFMGRVGGGVSGCFKRRVGVEDPLSEDAT